MENTLFHSHPFGSNSAHILPYSNDNSTVLFHIKIQFFADWPFSAAPLVKSACIRSFALFVARVFRRGDFPSVWQANPRPG